MFILTKTPLIEFIRDKRFEDPEVGGAVSFEGRVRNLNEGKKVRLLEYQAYEEMALKEGEKILQEALKKFPIKKAFCVHRHGQLKVGELAVWVFVTARHRREAFEACQYIIDTVKRRVPLWKKEYYEEHSETWVGCHGCQH
ncbi:molybdenum cofactor biosynthesis protein MoaE [Bacteriovoracales bacterium]|nr:molybdenum cofactor biosynthesis protein MoaE [Bacteriovoracales bacterium]